MQVKDLAKDLKVDAKALLQLLRKLGIKASDADAELSDAAVAKAIARVERERRSGERTASEALSSAIEEAQGTTRRRRRRRAPEPEPEEAADEEPEDEEEAAGADVAEEAEPEAAEAEEEEAGDEPAEEEAEAPVAEAEEPVEAAAEEDEDAVEADDDVPASEAEEVEDEPEPTEEAAAVDEEESAPAKPEPVRRGAVAARKPKPAASAGPGGKVRIQAEGYTSDGRRQRKDKKKGKRRKGVDQDAVQENISRVMAELKGGGKKSKKRRSTRPSQEELEAQEEEEREEREREEKTVRVNEFLTVAELAELIDESASSIVGSAFKNLGLMVTINQRLDFDQIELLLEEFGFQAEREESYGATEEAEDRVEDRPEDLEPRPPVVTVMGHVDHGKTLLLDRIRKSNVVAGEAGGITQHIGAYHVDLDDGRAISFLDTPGHAAFTAMRARGADVTDIVILIVAADDSVMPQTVEAISHAKNAGVPLIVAINKVDLPAAEPMRVKQELLQHEVTVEEFGGEVLVAEISAKTGEGIDDLLEKILLQSELLELKANPNREAEGTVIEAKLDVGKGPMVTILVQNGTLRVGDDFICGLHDGRIRAMLDERGEPVEEAGPGVPVQILGAGGVPQAGDSLVVMGADRAGDIASTRQRLEREKQLRVKERGLKLGDFSQLLGEGEVDTLPIIVKADVDGSVQAVSDALEQLSTDEVGVEIVHRAVGAVNESDVLLAQTAGAVVVGFRVRPDANARQLAEREGVEITTYDVIYEAVDEIRSALEGMLSPERTEKLLGAAEVRETFRITKVGTVAGCYVTEGAIGRNARVRLVRDGVVVYDGELASLKRFKDDVKEVREGFECGIGIANFNDVKIGDVIEAYVVEETARTLAGAAQPGR